MNIDQLKASLSLDNIQRWQKHRKDNKKNDAVHAYRVTVLYRYLGGIEVDAMLTHDNDEIFTGDIPSPSKKFIQGLEQFKYVCVPFVDEKEKRLGKLCDILELVIELKEDLEQYGHLPKRLMEIYEEELQRVLDIAKELGKTKEVRQLLKEVVK